MLVSHPYLEGDYNDYISLTFPSILSRSLNSRSSPKRNAQQLTILNVENDPTTLSELSMTFRIRLKLLSMAYKVKGNLSEFEDSTLPYFSATLAVLNM